MKLSNRKKQALEKITGKPWDSWHPEAIRAYFAFTDKGVRTPLFDRVWRLQLPDNEFNEVEQSLWDLMQCHQFHPYDVKCWAEDFRKGLLSPQDFTEPQIDYEKWISQGCPEEKPLFVYPEAFIKHALEIRENSLYNQRGEGVTTNAKIKGLLIQPAPANIGDTVVIAVKAGGKLPPTYRKLKKEILPGLTIIGPDGEHQEQNLR